MRTTLLLIAVVGLAGSASATFEVWFTNPNTGGIGYDPAGLVNPARMFVPTGGLHQDYDYYDEVTGEVLPGPYRVGTFPTAWTTPEIAVGEPVYIWFRFNGETNGITIQSIHLDMRATSGAEPWRNCATNTGARIQDIAYYVQDNTAGNTLFGPRWNGSQIGPDYCDFRNDEQVLVAVTAAGISNTSSHVPVNLYKGGAASNPLSRVCLLGAVKFDSPGDYYFALGSEGISIEGQPTYPINFVSGHVIVPEPVSTLLAGLGVLILRRR